MSFTSLLSLVSYIRFGVKQQPEKKNGKVLCREWIFKAQVSEMGTHMQAFLKLLCTSFDTVTTSAISCTYFKSVVKWLMLFLICSYLIVIFPQKLKDYVFGCLPTLLKVFLVSFWFISGLFRIFFAWWA